MEHYTQIISKTIHSDFLQKDIILTILGNQLLKDDNYKNTQKTKEIFDELLKKNNYIAGFGLVNTDGNLIVTSSNIKNTSDINLKTNKVTRYDFDRALDSEVMVVGRTIFFKPLGEWIIPIRKAIRDANGDVIGVMTAGIRNKKNTHYLDSLNLSKEKSVIILKDYDNEQNMYPQYVRMQKMEDLEKLYNTPVSQDLTNIALAKIESKYGYNAEDLRTNNQTVSYRIKDRYGDEYIVGFTYNQSYKIWLLVRGKSSVLWDEFTYVLLVYTAIFILSILVIYILFKNIIASDKRREDELIYLAEHDVLTCLPNRTYLYKHINNWTSVNENQYHVLYLDLDNFKNINDKFGHIIGDKILVEVARRLSAYCNNGEMLIRQGGDEFIVLKNYLASSSLEDFLEKLILLISEVYYVENNEFRIGISVGVACYPEDALEIENLLSFADTAMYEAKKRKNSFCFFSESIRHRNVERTDIEQELRGAIQENELGMVYQPQVNIDGSLSGVEALVRWKNKNLGFVPPDKFIEVAEATGLMRELGIFIIRESLQQIKGIQKKMNIKFTLSVNLSVIQLIEADFLETLLSIIEEEKFDKSLLTLEITESLSIQDLGDVIPLLHAIRNEGIEISLDDFGTGYSSLSVLRDLPINELKIDKSFIDKIVYDDIEKALVESIISIGKNFEMKTVAEGVESMEQVEILKDIKCDIFQGYYYSKPLSLEDLTHYIDKHKKS